MTDFPSSTPLPLHIYSISRFGDPYASPGFNAPASTLWGGANYAHFCPIRLPWAYPIRRLFWANGSAPGGNWSIGIYYPDGTGIYTSGSIAASGASQLQYHTPTIGEFLLTPGKYYLGLQHSTTTNNQAFIGVVVSADSGSNHGLLTQNVGSMPLPAQATFARYNPASQFPYPFCGFTRTPSGF